MSQAVLSVTRQMSVRDVLQMIVRSARSLVGARYAALGVPDAGRLVRRVRGGRGQRRPVGGDRPAAAPARHARRAAQRGQAGAARRHPQGPQVRGLAGRPPADVALPRRAGPRRRRDPRHHLPGQQGLRRRREARVHRARRGAPLPVRRARRDRADQRPAVRAQPRAVHRAGTLPARPRPARRGHPEAVQLRAHARAAAALAARDPPAPTGSGPRSRWSASSAPRPTPSCARSSTAWPRRTWRRPGWPHPCASTRCWPAGRTASRSRSPPPACPPLPPEAEAALYRVAQEALHNALRHAGASGVRVALARTPRQVVLEVSDDGRGFAPERAVRRPRARARRCGSAPRRRAARLTIRSGPKGTTVRMTVPAKAAR